MLKLQLHGAILILSRHSLVLYEPVSHTYIFIKHVYKQRTCVNTATHLTSHSCNRVICVSTITDPACHFCNMLTCVSAITDPASHFSNMLTCGSAITNPRSYSCNMGLTCQQYVIEAVKYNLY